MSKEIILSPKLKMTECSKASEAVYKIMNIMEVSSTFAFSLLCLRDSERRKKRRSRDEGGKKTEGRRGSKSGGERPVSSYVKTARRS